MTHRCVFLDRDGTINEEVCRLTEISQFRLIAGAAEAIRRFNRAGFRVVVVTNQAAVARGSLSEERLKSIHVSMRDRLRAEGAAVDAIYYCPHHPTDGIEDYRQRCDCRKPNAGMIERAVREHEIAPAESFLVGDKVSDLLAGLRAGCRTVLVRTGHGREHERRLEENNITPDHVADDLATAADWILEQASCGATR